MQDLKLLLLGMGGSCAYAFEKITCIYMLTCGNDYKRVMEQTDNTGCYFSLSTVASYYYYYLEFHFMQPLLQLLQLTKILNFSPSCLYLSAPPTPQLCVWESGPGLCALDSRQTSLQPSCILCPSVWCYRNSSLYSKMLKFTTKIKLHG